MKWSWNSSAVTCVLITALGILYALGQLRNAQHELHGSMDRLEHTKNSVSEYQSLVSAQQDTLHGTKPQQDVEAKVDQGLEFAKINPRPRFQVNVQADRAYSPIGSTRIDSTAGLREQDISILIPNLSEHEIGQFLVYWREHQHVWSPKQIKLEHDQRSRLNRFTLQLDCVAVYHGSGA